MSETSLKGIVPCGKMMNLGNPWGEHVELCTNSNLNSESNCEP